MGLVSLVNTSASGELIAVRTSFLQVGRSVSQSLGLNCYM
jgi:hypothetical protein